jgi:hypothetical protein
MPGLVPGIHAKPENRDPRLVDGRDKPGHDGRVKPGFAFEQ